MPVSDEEYLEAVYNLFTVLYLSRSFERYEEHVEKLNVDAGDHCLYTSKVQPGRSRTITSICSMASCSGITRVTLAIGFMHNVFEIKRVNTPLEDTTTCQEGTWLLGPGQYAQACFTGVPAGCDLHLYVRGSRRRSEGDVDMLYRLPGGVLYTLPGLPSLPGLPFLPEYSDVEGYLWINKSDTYSLEKRAFVTGELVASYSTPGAPLYFLACDGYNIWLMSRYLRTLYKMNPDSGLYTSVGLIDDIEVRGMAWHRGFLYLMDADNNRLLKVDPSDASTVATLSIPSGVWRDLTSDGQYFWIDETLLKRIYRYDPITETLSDYVDSPGQAVNGVTFIGNYLWIITAVGLGHDIYAADTSTGTMYYMYHVPRYAYGGCTFQRI